MRAQRPAQPRFQLRAKPGDAAFGDEVFHARLAALLAIAVFAEDFHRASDHLHGVHQRNPHA